MFENMMRSLLGLPRKATIEKRISTLEIAFVKLCDILEEHVKRIDNNTKILDQSVKNVMTAVVDSSHGFRSSNN